MTPGADPLHKVTIIPRGMALGVTMQLPSTTSTPTPRNFWKRSLPC
jgi:cell division protease FtsH